MWPGSISPRPLTAHGKLLLFLPWRSCNTVQPSKLLNQTQRALLLCCCSFKKRMKGYVLKQCLFEDRVFLCCYYDAIFKANVVIKAPLHYVFFFCLRLNEERGQCLLWILCRRIYLKNGCYTVYSLLLALCKAAERSRWQFTFLALRNTSAHVSYTVSVFFFGDCGKNLSSASSARSGHRGETNCTEAQKQEVVGCTYCGSKLQLRSLSVALLEELTGHQLGHLDRRKRII